MNEDMVLHKLAEHDKRFDRLESDFSGFKEQIVTGQNEILSIVRRLDEERVFSTRWVERMEADIQKIKSHLKL